MEASAEGAARARKLVMGLASMSEAPRPSTLFALGSKQKTRSPVNRPSRRRQSLYNHSCCLALAREVSFDLDEMASASLILFSSTGRAVVIHYFQMMKSVSIPP